MSGNYNLSNEMSIFFIGHGSCFYKDDMKSLYLKLLFIVNKVSGRARPDLYIKT